LPALLEEVWGFWIQHDEVKIAGIVRSSFAPSGVSFVTPDDFGLQVAVMSRGSGFEIPSHAHLPVPRALVGTQEVLLIRSGRLRADLYSPTKEYLCSVELEAGDLIILNTGGHGFVASSDCLFVEVKQGPFVEGKDKVVFPSILEADIPVRIVG
jgi:hypothetical protein